MTSPSKPLPAVTIDRKLCRLLVERQDGTSDGTDEATTADLAAVLAALPIEDRCAVTDALVAAAESRAAASEAELAEVRSALCKLTGADGTGETTLGLAQLAELDVNCEWERAEKAEAERARLEGELAVLRTVAGAACDFIAERGKIQERTPLHDALAAYFRHLARASRPSPPSPSKEPATHYEGLAIAGEIAREKMRSVTATIERVAKSKEPTTGEVCGTCGHPRWKMKCYACSRAPTEEPGTFAAVLSKRKYGPSARHCYCGHLWDSHDATGCVFDREECDCNAPKPVPETTPGQDESTKTRGEK